jgi:hypothetical protein
MDRVVSVGKVGLYTTKRTCLNEELFTVQESCKLTQNSIVILSGVLNVPDPPGYGFQNTGMVLRCCEIGYDMAE